MRAGWSCCPHCGRDIDLSPRESVLARLLSQAGPDGLPIEALAEQLGINEGTIRKMVWSIRGKRGVNAVLTDWGGAYRWGEAVSKPRLAA